MKRGARYLAQMAGERFYYLNTPCRRGHFAERTLDGGCTECRRVRERERYAANPELGAAKARKFRIGKEALFARRAREARAKETPMQHAKRLEKAKVKQREWRLKNPKHPGSIAAKKAYKKAHPGKVLADTVKRRLVFMQRTPKWLTPDDHWMMEEIYDLAARRTALRTGGHKWHVDHIVPLQGKTVSGLHVPLNLRVIPAIENVRKYNRFVAT